MQADWIFIYGPPGCGKSSLGRKLAEMFALPFLDLDEEVEKTCGRSIPDLFAAHGESAFRQLEKQTLQSLVSNQPGVMALGGGSLLDEDSRALIEAHGPVACLTASPPVLVKRLETSTPIRPLLVGDLEINLAGLLESRAAHYASFPLQVAVGDSSLDESAWQLQARLGRFHLTGMGVGCDVHLFRGALDELGLLLEKCGLGNPVVLVSDEHVAPLYSQQALRSLTTVGINAQLIIIPAGEQHKTPASLQSLWDAFLQTGLERRGTVIAMGGGVTCDLVGFAAATFMRGVTWVAIPTSLLAMVDASLGGKTGVDLPQGKNLVGAFYPPRLVLADPNVLSTLPEREISSGMAEVVKAGIIADPQLFETCTYGLESIQSRWMELVPPAVGVKIRLVQEDPYEQGRREALNLGHTIGHALERCSNYEISHGEAISVGLVAETRLAERIGLAQAGQADQIKQVLTKLGLPVELPPEIPLEALVSAMQADKKRQQGDLRFTLLAAIGDVRTGITLQPTEIISILSNHKVEQL